MHHVSRRLLKAGLADVVAGFLAHDDSPDIRGQLFLGSAAAHLAVEVVVGLREETGAESAVRRDADAAAVAAEGMRDRCDDADLADAVGEGVAPGGLAGGTRWQLDQACRDAAGRTPR